MRIRKVKSKVNGAKDYGEKGRESVTDVGFKLQTFHFAFTKIAETVTVKNPKILDIGCSSGKLLEYLQSARIFADYHGIEIRESAVKSFRKKYPEIDVVCGDARYLLHHFNRNNFDYIVANELVEHVPKKVAEEILKSSYSALKKKGYIIITTPNHSAKLNSKTEAKFGHVHTFTPTELYDSLYYTGFSNIDFIYGKYCSVRFNFITMRKKICDIFGDMYGNYLLQFMRTHYGTNLSTYILGGMCGEQAGTMKIIAQKA